MADKIFIRGLEVFCIIGTLPRERKRKRKIVIDLEFSSPVKRAAKRDDLRDALDYQEIASCATRFVSKSRFYLIETLAERLASLLLKEFPIKSVGLTVSKPKALRNAQSVGVHLKRKRTEDD